MLAVLAKLSVFLIVLGTATATAVACGGGTASTTLKTTLSGGGKEGEEITVAEGSGVKDTATLSGEKSAKAEGTVTYAVYSDKECKTLVSKAGEVTVKEGKVPASEEKKLEAGAVYYWQAVYSGDANNSASTSVCSKEVETVKAKVTLSTLLFGGGKEGEEITVAEGSKVRDQATLSGTKSGTAKSAIKYSVYKDKECKTLASEAGEGEVKEGKAPASEEKELEAGAVYYWQAKYGGDSLHEASTSACSKEVVKAAVTLSTSLIGGKSGEDEPVEGEEISVVQGAIVGDAATMSGTKVSTATGKMQYAVYKDKECKELVTKAGEGEVEEGKAPASEEVELEVGVYYWQVTYEGDSLHQGSVSPCTERAKVLAATSITATLLGESEEGDVVEVSDDAVVTDTATLSGTNASEATGTVQYLLYSDPECKEIVAKAGEVTVAGKTVPASSGETLEPGLYYWRAVYSGDGSNYGSTSACGAEAEIVLEPITTTLSGGEEAGTQIAVPVGTTVNDKATLNGEHAAEATGSVEYLVYSDEKCEKLFANAGKVEVKGASVPASSKVKFEKTGTYYWQAAYSGDENNPAVTGDCGAEIAVVEMPTSLTTVLSGGGEEGAEIEVEEGTAVTAHASVSGSEAGTAGGTVSYTAYADSSCTEVAGVAEVADVEKGIVGASSEVTLPPGTYYWLAEYTGDGVNQASESACGAGVEIVTTPITATLSGGEETGDEIDVPEGAMVSDKATLNGEHAAEATGSVEYLVYSDEKCEKLFANAGKVEVKGASVPASSKVELKASAIYYWQVKYSGDAKNSPATSACGAEQAQVQNPLWQYVALGDSFSSGQGVMQSGGSYYPTTDIWLRPTVHGRNYCHRSADAWPARVWEAEFGNAQVIPPTVLTRFPRFIFRACSGAITTNIWSGGPNAEAEGQYDEFAEGMGWLRPTVAQAPWLWLAAGVPNPNIEKMTITIGGNDAHFADIIKACWAYSRRIYSFFRGYSPISCQERIETGEAEFGKVETGIRTLLAEVAAAAPNAQIRVLLYPRMLSLRLPEIVLTDDGGLVINNSATGRGQLTAAASLVDFINNLDVRVTDGVNTAGLGNRVSILATPVEAFDRAFGEHRLGESHAWLNGLILPLHREESFHPKSCGHKAIARLVQPFVTPRANLIGLCFP